MFFILNGEKAVIAADQDFLDSVGAPSIYLLAELFRSDDFQLDEASQTYRIGNRSRAFTRSKLQTIFGNGYYYQVAAQDAPSDTAPTEDVLRIAEPVQSPIETADVPTEPADRMLIETPVTAPAEPDEAPWVPDTHPSKEATAAPSAHEAAPDIMPEPEKNLSVPPSEPGAVPEPTAPPEPQVHKEEEDLLALLDLDTEEAQTAADMPETDTPKPDTGMDELLDLIDLDEPDGPTAAQHTETHPSAPPAAETGALKSVPDLAAAEPDTPKASPDDLDDLFDLIDLDAEKSKMHPQETSAAPAQTLDAPFGLKEEETIGSETAKKPPQVLPVTPFADYHANAEMIGITPDEYIGFLRQFTEESLGYEAGLRSNDIYVFKKNLTSIKDASQLLHLPRLSETLAGLEEATSAERGSLIDTFFGMVQHIRRDLQARPSTPDTVSQHHESAHTPMDAAPQEPAAPAQPEPIAPLETFDAIEPIPFDFSTQAASNELGLPETLVQEFVSDFVKQAEENIPVFQEAQQKGDIDTIQKTAHLLKGAASNLRIDPLAETLKALQYNEAPDKVPALFRTFVGQLKTLIQFTDNTVR